jgi:hypothetical protein
MVTFRPQNANVFLVSWAPPRSPVILGGRCALEDVVLAATAPGASIACQQCERNYGNAPFLRRRQTRKGLAPIRRETNKSGDQTVESGRIMITDAGRRVLDPLIGRKLNERVSLPDACSSGRRWRAAWGTHLAPRGLDSSF